MATTSSDDSEPDIFDAFGLRDDDTSKDFDPFASDDFVPTPVPVPVPAPVAAAISANDSADSDPFSDPFNFDGAATAPRGFKKISLPPPAADTRPVSSGARARSAATKPKVGPVVDDFDIGPPSSGPFPSVQEQGATEGGRGGPAATGGSPNASFATSSPTAAAAAAAAAAKAALPPRLGIKFLMHEEVTSYASDGRSRANDGMDSCDVNIEGKVSAFVQSSDATRNVPFQLVLRDSSSSSSSSAQISINKAFVDDSYKVSIPKTSIGNVPIASYTCTANVQNMPVLVQSKISVKQKSSVHVDIQVRSNLNNTGDLADFTLAVPIPSVIDGKSILLTKGEGAYDELKRVVKWKRATLPRGESFLVGFEAQTVRNSPTSSVQSSKLPILLRCRSVEDKISTMEVDATAVVGHPAAVHTARSTSFRLLHRVTT